MKLDSDLELKSNNLESASRSILSCLVPLLGIIVACLPVLPPVIQRVFHTSIFSSAPYDHSSSSRFSKFWPQPSTSGMRADDPEMPLVPVHSASMDKPNDLPPWNIQITYDWELYSSRGSTRLDRSSVPRF